MSRPPRGASTSSSASEWPPPPRVPSAYVPAGSVTKYLIVASQSTGAWYEVLCWARIGAWRARSVGHADQRLIKREFCELFTAALSQRQVCGGVAFAPELAAFAALSLSWRPSSC